MQNDVLKHLGTCFLSNKITSDLMHFGLYGYLGNIYETRSLGFYFTKENSSVILKP
jgi:hypothetical protein